MTGTPCAVVWRHFKVEEVGRVNDYDKMPTEGPINTNPDVQRIQQAITDWWMDKSAEEVNMVAPKAAEYGATDLAEIGRTMGMIINRTDLNHVDATEIGIYFYVLGKMARWTAAIREGRRVSDDTLLDIGIYIKMAQRSRQVGGWPFNPEDKA